MKLLRCLPRSQTQVEYVLSCLTFVILAYFCSTPFFASPGQYPIRRAILRVITLPTEAAQTLFSSSPEVGLLFMVLNVLLGGGFIYLVLRYCMKPLSKRYLECIKSSDRLQIAAQSTATPQLPIATGMAGGILALLVWLQTLIGAYVFFCILMLGVFFGCEDCLAQHGHKLLIASIGLLLLSFPGFLVCFNPYRSKLLLLFPFVALVIVSYLVSPIYLGMLGWDWPAFLIYPTDILLTDLVEKLAEIPDLKSRC